MSSVLTILIVGITGMVVLAAVGVLVFLYAFKTDGKTKNQASTATASTDSKADKAGDKPAKPADKPVRKHFGLIGDLLWIILGLAFLNWFWAHTFSQSWGMLRTHESFWATQIGVAVVAFCLKNIKNSIVVGICRVILIMLVISIGTIVLSAIQKPKVEVPEPKTVIKSETVQAGVWSREYSRAELESVTAVADREWQVCLIIDENTQKEKVTEPKPLPLGELIKPWNAKWMRFRSMTREMKVEFRVLETP